MDVKTAFLNGDLEEEIYMDQPEGFTMPGNEHKVCKLLKYLYGLKQAPRQWHEKFDQCLLSNGFKTNESDKCIYYKNFDDAHVIICLYVDDLLIFSPNMDIINAAKMLLKNNFDMNDLGEVNVILSMKISRTSNGICRSISLYRKNFEKNIITLIVNLQVFLLTLVCIFFLLKMKMTFTIKRNMLVLLVVLDMLLIVLDLILLML